jgi:phage baseplate assembly protein W
MEYVIDTSKLSNINWGATGDERILQNINNLISTFKLEVAYDRDKGIDGGLIDKPKDIAAAYYTSEVFRVVQEYEPRATVKEVQLTKVDENGNMQFKVVVDI